MELLNHFPNFCSFLSTTMTYLLLFIAVVFQGQDQWEFRGLKRIFLKARNNKSVGCFNDTLNSTVL